MRPLLTLPLREQTSQTKYPHPLHNSRVYTSGTGEKALRHLPESQRGVSSFLLHTTL